MELPYALSLPFITDYSCILYLLYTVVKMLPSCRYATSLDHDENGNTTVLEEFLDAAVKGQCEG